MTTQPDTQEPLARIERCVTAQGVILTLERNRGERLARLRLEWSENFIGMRLTGGVVRAMAKLFEGLQ